jgi:dipeptidyl aminopeptidase/acylaminoacyl peptidase
MPEREPISLESIADRKRPAAPQISPDGDAIAVTVSHLSKTDNRATSSIWMIQGDREPFPFTGGLAGAADPQWSPDGTSLLFTSYRDDKDDKSGLFLIRANGGEGQQLGNIRGDISQPRWSPDGAHIACIMTDQDTDADEKRKEDKRDHVVFEEEPRHKRLWHLNPDTGASRLLTTGDFSVHDYCWGPDSDELIIITTPQPTENSLFGQTKVARVPVSGGLSTSVTTFRMAPSTPVVREVNGEHIVALVANDHRSDPSPSIWTVPLTGGAARQLLPNLRGAVQTIVADPSHPDRLFAIIVEGTHARLYSVDCGSGARARLDEAMCCGVGSINYAYGFSSSADGAKIAFVWSASDRPEEVWTIERSGNGRQRTTLGSEFLDDLTLGETVRWQSFDGVEIEGTLIRPRGSDPNTPLPLFIQIHGGPAWQWEDSLNLSWHDWAQMLASRGWAVLLPNPRGSTGYGSAFEKLLQDDVGGGECKDLIAAADAMVERGITDPDRLAIGGWSWGGFLTARTITQTNRFKAAVMGAGVANLASDHGAGDIAEYNTLLYPGHPYDEANWDYYAAGTPIRQASRVTTPTLILHGERDDRVHPTQGQEFYRALQVNGVPVQFVKYPREGHGFKEREHQLDLMNRICTWLDKWVQTTDP